MAKPQDATRVSAYNQQISPCVLPPIDEIKAVDVPVTWTVDAKIGSLRVVQEKERKGYFRLMAAPASAW